MKKGLVVLAIAAVMFLVLVTTSGSFLVVDDLHKADVIVVLAGETDRRPARALELLDQGYAPKILLDVPASAKIFDIETMDIASNYVRKLPQHDSIAICPITGLSTKTEAMNVLTCIGKSDVKSMLIVTSDYHTRRARSAFKREIAGKQIFVTAATDDKQFGPSWWKRRQWAKVNFDEWIRLMWWTFVDRWR